MIIENITGFILSIAPVLISELTKESIYNIISTEAKHGEICF